MRTLKLSWLFALAGAIVIPACSDSKSSLNPTAPSAISSNTVNVEAGLGVDAGESGTTAKGNDKDRDSENVSSSTGKGNGNGSGNGNGNSGGGNGNSGGGNGNGGGGNGNGGGGNSGPGNGNGGGNSGPGNGNGGGNSGPGNGNPTPPAPTGPTPTAPAPPVQTKVEIEGLITAVGAASITVNGQVVLVTADTEIRHGSRHFALSDLKVGDRVHVKATRITSTGPGATTTIQANEIKLQNRDDDEDDDDDEDEDDDRAVTVTATDALASETGSNTGTFRLHRDRSNSLVQLPLTVTFTLNGTATNGTDYTTVPLTKTFPAGEDSVDVVITPIVDALVEGPETIVLTLTGVAPFQIGTPSTAVIVLSDGTSPVANPVVTVVASDPTASEAGDPGVFHFTRTGPTTLPLTVTVMIAGTATNGLDYTPFLSSVSFLAGQAGVDVTVSPLVDTVIDPSETVIITLVDGPDYDLGAPATQAAMITITGS